MKELWQVLAELEMCSQVSAVNLEPSSARADEDIGGRRPSGGADYGDDREHEMALKSAAHFRYRLARGANPHRLLGEAEAALEAHRRQPAPTGELEYGSPSWKRWVGESDMTAEEIAVKYHVSRRRIAQVKAQYSVTS